MANQPSTNGGGGGGSSNHKVANGTASKLEKNNHHKFNNNNNNNNNYNNNKRPHSSKWQEINTNRVKLPVWEHRGAFMRLLEDNQSIIVVGETGSGKTTQIPQWCMDYCVKKSNASGQKLCVACTQPRRVAAMSVAIRVAEEMDVRLGQEVGYSVRFESETSDKTRLKYLTDGMLLREAMLDGLLKSYGIIILDEAHERTLQTEILFGVIKRAFDSRNSSFMPLKVIIMSATINVKLFKRYFDSPVLHIQGRQHPVQDLFAEIPQSDLLISTLICVFQVHRTCDEGDILVFCSGQDEIQTLIIQTKRALKQAPASMQNLTPYPLYASLPAAKQMRVFEQNNPKAQKQTNGFTTNGYHKHNGHAGSDSSTSSSSGESPSEHRDQANNNESTTCSFNRRVIFATNVAETSITIPNIKYVIDTGKVKCRYYCPKTGLESLKVTNISKAQSKQRAGRAGRVAPGTCYRLYTLDDHSKLVEYLPPEIRRCNLDGVVLQMISIGIKNVNSFEYLERPDSNRLKSALVNLLNLKAIKPVNQEDMEKIQQSSSTGSNDKDKQQKSPQKKTFLQPAADNNSILNLDYDLTAIGKRLCVFPLDPAMARIILAAEKLNCLCEALTVVSLLAIETLFYIPPNKQDQAETMLRKFHSNEGDIVMLLNVFRAFKRTIKLNKSGIALWCSEHFIHVKNLKTARMIRKQLLDLCKSLKMEINSCGQDTTNLRRALTFGLFNNAATMFDGKYRNKSSIEVHIHPNSCLFKARPECILYVEVVETNKCYMRNCTLVDINWIREVSSTNLMRHQLG